MTEAARRPAQSSTHLDHHLAALRAFNVQVTLIEQHHAKERVAWECQHLNSPSIVLPFQDEGVDSADLFTSTRHENRTLLLKGRVELPQETFRNGQFALKPGVNDERDGPRSVQARQREANKW